MVFDFPGVALDSRLVPGWGEMGYCWKGLACEPLHYFGARLNLLVLPFSLPLGCANVSPVKIPVTLDDTP